MKRVWSVRWLSSGLSKRMSMGRWAIQRTGNGKDYAIQTALTELTSVARETKSLDAKILERGRQ